MTNVEIIRKLRDMAAQILTPSSKGKHFFNEAADALESLAKDKKRLDWLDGERKVHYGGQATWEVIAYVDHTKTVREAIDAHLSHLPK